MARAHHNRSVQPDKGWPAWTSPRRFPLLTTDYFLPFDICHSTFDIPPMRPIPVRPDPWHILWHYANGRMPDFLNKQDGPVGWLRWSHRGIQPLDQIQFPNSQK